MSRVALGFVLGLGCSAGFAWAHGALVVTNTSAPAGIRLGETLHLLCVDPLGRPGAVMPMIGSTVKVMPYNLQALSVTCRN